MMNYMIVLLALVASFVLNLSEARIEITADEIAHYNRHHRHLIDGGKRILYTNTNGRCDDPMGSPCGPESSCEQVDETSYICENEFFYGCIAGCSPGSHCTQGDDMVYYCECDEGYYQPQPWMPCREDRRRK